MRMRNSQIRAGIKAGEFVTVKAPRMSNDLARSTYRAQKSRETRTGMASGKAREGYRVAHEHNELNAFGWHTQRDAVVFDSADTGLGKFNKA